MLNKKLFSVVLVLLCTVPVFSQNEPDTDSESSPVYPVEDFWISPCAELAMYSANGGVYGGGFAFGYGRGVSIGMKAAFFFEDSYYKTITMEINLLLRFYLHGRDSISGPFLQFLGGPVIFARDSSIGVPSEYGVISAGLSLGWRFLFNDRWFAEPMIRGGFPYVAGGGVSAGVRF